MVKAARHPRVVLSPDARRDIREIANWSEDTFGERAAARYRGLLKQAFRDIESDPERPGSQSHTELGNDIRIYHLRFSRDRARTALGIVQDPRHFVVYRRRPNTSIIDILRVLHDARDLQKHLS